MSFNRYKVPGVHWEETFSMETLPLLTGVPVFIGMVPRADLPVSRGLELSPLAGASGIWQVLDREGNSNRTVGFFGSWQEFEIAFDVLKPLGYLGYSVRGFFRNGGGPCHVLLFSFDHGIPLDTVLARALESTETLNLVDLICLPDLMWLFQHGTISSQEQVVRMQKSVLDHCEALGHRFAILDSLPEMDATGVRGQRGGLRDGSCGALYYPWVKVPDGPGADGAGYLPPCGHVAGVCARTDRVFGVHKAPANEVLEEVVGLEFQVRGSIQADLNPLGINCIRAFPGRGIRIWGARTLSLDAGLVYVNVRRLIGTVGRWMESQIAFTVFEPNNARLWTRITRELTSFLSNLYLRGALSGSTQEEAFYVKCDQETNPMEMRETGRVVTEIGLAPTVPGEFVFVRITQTNTGTDIIISGAATGSAVSGPKGGMAWREEALERGRPRVEISGVEFNPPGKDISMEHVLVRNQEERIVDMTGWTLHDLAYNTFIFPSFNLPPGVLVRIWTKEGENTATDLYWGRRAPVWNNAGDKAFLRDDQGRLVAEFTITV